MERVLAEDSETVDFGKVHEMLDRNCTLANLNEIQ